ncbi:hypothetical protein Pelo_3978 [Pelomyxa schiedti]|nr:hypothetical protein Pelo_3978 [Pelomyxa schiedti]
MRKWPVVAVVVVAGFVAIWWDLDLNGRSDGYTAGDLPPGWGLDDIASCSISFSILSLNTFLVPWCTQIAAVYKWMPFLRTPTCTRETERADKITDLVSTFQPDFISLQEVWGNTEILQEGLVSAGYNIVPDYQSWGSTLKDAIKRRWLALGGLFLSYKPGWEVIWTRREQFKSSGTWSAKGVTAALYTDTHVWIMTINTHLDTEGHPENQIEQIHELFLFVNSSVYEVLDKKFFGFPFQMVVLITGDFNMKPHSTSYEAFLSTFATMEPIDIHHLQYGPIVANADYTYSSNNSMATFYPDSPEPVAHDFGIGAPDGSGRIDYIWMLKSVSSRKPQPLCRPTCRQFEVLRQPRGHELSDHWGLLARFEFWW